MTKILVGERRRYVLAIKISEQLATIITCIVHNDPHVITIVHILWLIAQHFIERWCTQIVFVFCIWDFVRCNNWQGVQFA